MTEPEVAGSDPTGIRTMAAQDGDEWVINGHKWFISGAKGATFAILIAKTDPDADPPQASNTAFLVDLPADGWEIVRDIDTMAGHGNHCEIRITDLRVPNSAVLGGRGNGHLLGQARLGPARLAHCMRWIAQAETARMLVSGRERQLHGAAPRREAGDPMDDGRLGDGAVPAKLMVLPRVQDRERAAVPPRGELRQASRGEHALKVVDRDPGARRTRLLHRHAAGADDEARPFGRLVDGADEVHQALIARNARRHPNLGDTRVATGDFDFELDRRRRATEKCGSRCVVSLKRRMVIRSSSTTMWTDRRCRRR
jgi:acyl-CoA dehydrogenase